MLKIGQKKKKKKASDEGHIFYYSGREDKHEHGVGFP